MKKEADYNNWNDRKKVLHKLDASQVYFRERQIWWCKIGLNVGYEQDGKDSWFERPVLILRKFNQFAFIGVPLSTSIENSRFRYRFNFGIDNPENVALISQIRFFDGKRLNMKIGTCSKKDFSEIRKAVREMFP